VPHSDLQQWANPEQLGVAPMAKWNEVHVSGFYAHLHVLEMGGAEHRALH
jgi:hypothetical protein